MRRTRNMQVLLGGMLVCAPVAGRAQAADSVRGRWALKADVLRPGAVALSAANAGASRRRLGWLVSAQYYFSRRRSLQLDWLHRGGARPREVEGVTAQLRLTQFYLSQRPTDPGAVYLAPLLGYRRLAWPALRKAEGQVPESGWMSAGLGFGVESVVRQGRPQLTLGFMMGSSVQYPLWQNGAYERAYQSELQAKELLPMPILPINYDLRGTVGLCF